MSKAHTITRQLDSSAIDAATYERDTYTLIITFKGGRSYRYEDVPKKVFTGLCRAESAGKYFNQRIKPVYSHA